MRFLLALMAMTLFAVSVGCEKPADTTKSDTPAAAAPESCLLYTSDAADE